MFLRNSRFCVRYGFKEQRNRYAGRADPGGYRRLRNPLVLDRSFLEPVEGTVRQCNVGVDTPQRAEGHVRGACSCEQSLKQSCPRQADVDAWCALGQESRKHCINIWGVGSPLDRVEKPPRHSNVRFNEAQRFDKPDEIGPALLDKFLQLVPKLWNVDFLSSNPSSYGCLRFGPDLGVGPKHAAEAVTVLLVVCKRLKVTKDGLGDGSVALCE